MLDNDVAETLRTLLRQVPGQSEEEAERIHRSWVQVRLHEKPRDEAPVPELVLATDLPAHAHLDQSVA